MRCTKPRQPALNENFNLPYDSHVKKHDTRLLIGRIAFLTCGKSDTRHLIGLLIGLQTKIYSAAFQCVNLSMYIINIDYFMESARVRYLRTSCCRIRKRTSERSERGEFSDTKTTSAYIPYKALSIL